MHTAHSIHSYGHPATATKIVPAGSTQDHDGQGSARALALRAPQPPRVWSRRFNRRSWRRRVATSGRMRTDGRCVGREAKSPNGDCIRLRASDTFSDRVSNCYGTDGPTPTSTVHTRDRLRMEYARLDHCRYEGKWYQRCRNWWTPRRVPSPHILMARSSRGLSATRSRIQESAITQGNRGPQRNVGHRERRKGGAYTLTRAFRRSLGSWI